MPNTFSPNTPQAGNFPANDQPLMNANNGYLQEFGIRDHQFTLLGAANSTDGTHKQVTLTNQAAPAFAGANSVIYANLANGQSQLFFQNTIGTVQLTSQIAAVPTVAANGASYLPGGLLIQWGTDTKSTGGSTTFPVAFSAPAYTVVLTPYSAPGAASANGLLTVLVRNANNFQIGNNTGTTQSYTYNWMAIGLA
jgi:hypothetical protein